MSRFRVFLLSALVTLFCLAPLYLLIIGGELFGVRQADSPADGVPVLTPTGDDSLTLLLVADGPAPAAALVRLDAWQRRAECLVLPADTVLLLDGAPVTLKECCAASGPLQLRRALEETLGAACQRYLALEPEALAEVFNEFSPVLDWDELGPIKDLALLRRFAFNGGKGALASDTAALLLRQSEADAVQLARLRSVLYGAFLQEGLPSLAQPVCRLLRSDARLLTDISAVDIYGIERLLTLLAADVPTVSSGVPDGKSTRTGYELSEEGHIQLLELLQPVQ